MQVFPYLLARIGGGSFDNLAPLNYSALVNRVAHLITQKKEKARLKAQLCENLLAGIKALPDQKIQNQVLNLRRDIFNQRPVKPQLLTVAYQHLPARLTAELASYLALIATIHSEENETAEVYNGLVNQSRRHLQQLAQDPALQKGLVLSSQSLLQAIKDYCCQEPGAFRKKEFQTEQSLLKYLTRMYTKTSPFSTFNNLALGTLTNLPDGAMRVHTAAGPTEPVVGHIRLNNNLFKYLKDLFLASKEIYLHLSVRANPTIAAKADHYVYLTNHNNVEAFQRVPKAPVLGLVLQLVQANAGGTRFATLAEEICTYVEAPAESIQDYLRQLISYGFLEFDLGVSGTDPDWDLKLQRELKYLEAQGVSHIAELSTTLADTRTRAEQYAQAPVAERQKILNQVYQQFRSTCLKLHAAAGLPETERKTPEELQAEWLTSQKEALKKKENTGPEANSVVVAVAEAPAAPPEVAFQHRSSTYFGFKPEQFFYEDTIREVALQVDDTKLTQLVANLNALLQEMRPFRGMAEEQELMIAYFKQKYGPEAKVNLLTFYEDFYREIKKPEAEWLAKQQQQALVKETPTHQPATTPPEINPEERDRPTKENLAPAFKPNLLTNSSAEKSKNWINNFTAAMQAAVAEKPEQVNLSLDFIRGISGNAAPGQPVVPNSYGAFVQLYQQKDDAGQWQLKGVLNATMGGYGKMLSRFLHIFPEEVTQTLKDWNRALQPANSLFIEDCDASYFNANLHPPLMPHEIRMPGGHNSLPVPDQLPISDFEVRTDALAGEIQLFHKPTGKRGFVFDLGFQGQGGRSQLFQLLDKFTRAEYLFSYPVVSGVNGAIEQDFPDTEAATPPEPRIVVRPRIMYQNQLVLQRKGWYVPKQLIPRREPDMTDWQYYLELNAWRQAQGIADEVYVTISSDRQHTGLDPEQIKKLGRDDYKPQYINFNYPLLVHLFEKLLTKVPYTLKIEEMLPNSEHLLKINNQRYVTEFVVQWYDI